MIVEDTPTQLVQPAIEAEVRQDTRVTLEIPPAEVEGKRTWQPAWREGRRASMVARRGW
jgi:hypothetical protein